MSEKGVGQASKKGAASIHAGARRRARRFTLLPPQRSSVRFLAPRGNGSQLLRYNNTNNKDELNFFN